MLLTTLWFRAARAQGLDDTDDYIQTLQSKWQSYNESIKKIQDEATDNAKDAVKDLVDFRIDMLKQDIKNEKDSIKKKLDYLKDFYQKQKKMLQDANDEEKYLEEQSERRKSVTDLQAELNQLEYDDSAWAQKRKIELAKDNSKISGTNPITRVLQILLDKPVPFSEPLGSSTTSSTSSTSSAPSLEKGSSITVKKSATHFSEKSNSLKMKSFVPGGSYTVYQTSGNEVLIGRDGVYTGWIKKTDIEGYAKGTRKAKAGLHAIDEIGLETIFESADGSRYKMFSGGEKVLNTKASGFLYEFANGGGDVLEKTIRGAFGGGLPDTTQPVVYNNEINMGNIIVNGKADQRTVSEIRRVQRDEINFMLKEFSRLK